MNDKVPLALGIIDNYDSFTYNLVQQIEEVGEEKGITVAVIRNDFETAESFCTRNLDGVIISPGPGTPSDTGICFDVLGKIGGKIPILGVCLGHQTIAAWLGGKVVRAQEPRHGRQSQLRIESSVLFSNAPNPFLAARYHSLVVEPESFPSSLQVTAVSERNEIMAFENLALKLFGVQFHPESFLTPDGGIIINNFLNFIRGA